MITNERQYRITRSQASKFREAINDFDEVALIRQGIDPVVANAQREGLKSQLQDLEHSLDHFDALRSGRVNPRSIEEHTKQELKNIIENHRRLNKTSEPYYLDAMAELARRGGHGLDFQKSFDLIRQAASERRYMSYKQLAEESGAEWSKVRHGMNPHLDELIRYAHGRGWPLLTAVVVNQKHVETGAMEPSALTEFIAAAKELGYVVSDEEAFLRDQQQRVFEWAALSNGAGNPDSQPKATSEPSRVVTMQLDEQNKNLQVNLMTYKGIIIREHFVYFADQDYIVSRWCFMNGLTYHFFWNASQCLEKFMKAALLENEKSSKGYNHNLDKLLRDISKLAGDLLPTCLKKPENTEGSWENEKLEGFVKRIAGAGSPDGRYGMEFLELYPADLYKLDHAVFSIRRLCRPLDSERIPGKTWRNSLKENDKLMPDPENGGGFALLTLPGRNKAVRHAGLNKNFFFDVCGNVDDVCGNVDDGSMFGGCKIRPSINYLISHLDDELKLKLVNWILDNIHLKKKIKEELQSLIGNQGE